MNYVATNKQLFTQAFSQYTATIKANVITVVCKVNTLDDNFEYKYRTQWIESAENFSELWGYFERKLNSYLFDFGVKASLEEGANRMDPIAARALRFLLQDYKDRGVQAILDFNSRSLLQSSALGI